MKNPPLIARLTRVTTVGKSLPLESFTVAVANRLMCCSQSNPLPVIYNVLAIETANVQQRLLVLYHFFVSFVRTRLNGEERPESASSLVLLGHLLKRVPLGYRSPRVSQHVAPVPQLAARRAAAKDHATDRFRSTDAIVVDNCYDQGYLLHSRKT